MPSEIVFNQGETVKEMYFVTEGVLLLTKVHTNGEIEYNYKKKDEYFGEKAIMIDW